MDGLFGVKVNGFIKTEEWVAGCMKGWSVWID